MIAMEMENIAHLLKPVKQIS
jgi:hypothetical protein